MDLDIVMTATIRPEVLDKTLESFMRNMFSSANCRLIINIDPVGRKDVTQDDVLDVARKYFSSIFFNTPDVANFPAAFKWAWSMAGTEYVFHLEDDWDLGRPIDLQDMVAIFGRHENLAILRLPYTRSTEDNIKTWNRFFPWNGDYYACPNGERASLGMCGHPSLIRGKFIKRTWPFIDILKNPEKQFHHGSPGLIAEVLNWQYGIYAKPGEPPAIRDIGRRWLNANGLRKRGSKAFFTEWEEVT